ncbi:hypothetical protein [Xanthomonas phage JGB6]|nr:hypothetical protein [Xanthomonas phage JGB6]
MNPEGSTSAVRTEAGIACICTEANITNARQLRRLVMITIDMEVPIYLTLNEVNTEYVQDELLKTALEFVQGC